MKTFKELLTLTFDDLPDTDETEGIGRCKGIRYRRQKIVASDEDGLPREYKVNVSSRDTLKIDRGWLTDEGKAQRLARMEAEVPFPVRQFVADFFPTAPCNPHNAVMLARHLCGMDSKFQGLLNWQQGHDLRAHGWTGKTNGEALDFIRDRYTQTQLEKAA